MMTWLGFPAWLWIVIGGAVAMVGLVVLADRLTGGGYHPGHAGRAHLDVATATLPRVEVAHEPPWEPAPPVFHPAPPAELGTWQPRTGAWEQVWDAADEAWADEGTARLLDGIEPRHLAETWLEEQMADLFAWVRAQHAASH